MMLQHIVLLEPADETGLAQIRAAMEILDTLPGKIDGLIGFQHGPNLDFEKKSERYPYGFICTFENRDALEAYASDPDHQRAGGMLVDGCKGGHEGIFVADLEV